MIILASHRCPCGERHLAFYAHIVGDLWPAWQYEADHARLTLIDEIGVVRGDVPADMFTRRELVALRHAEAVLQFRSPLMVAHLVETLDGLVPMRWMGGAAVEAKTVAAGIRRRAVVS
jgi:hypothetical protein